MSPPENDPRRPVEPPRERGYEVVWTPAPEVVDDGDLPARYELARDLGDGCVGPVFAVRDRESEGRLVRFEIVPGRMLATEDDAQRLEACLVAARRVVSPYVARVCEVGRLEDGRVFVVSELVEGETLRDRLQREGALHPRHALEIARQILLALEAAQGQGVAHGALNSASIWLAGGAPKSDVDPHGVAVRVADLGLASSVGTAPSTPDVEAVGALLGEMGGPQLAAEKFASVREMHAAVEGALARLRKRGTSSRALSAAAIVAIVAVVIVVAVRAFQVNSIDAAERDDAAQRVRGELETRSAELRAAAEAKEALQAEAQAQRDARLAESARAAELQDTLTRSREGFDALRAEAEESRRIATAAAERARALDERIRALESDATPRARAARGFDAAMDAIEAGRGAESARRIAALDGDGAPTADFARDATECAAGLEEFARTREVATLRRAGAALERAELSLANFPHQASAWLEHGAVGDVRSSRVERAAIVYALLGDTHARARAAAHVADLDDWAPIAAAPGVQDPDAAFRHAGRFGCEHISELAARFATEVLAWAIVDGALDVERLATFPQLAAWQARVDAGVVALPDTSARSLELLAFAQRWYDGDPDNNLGIDWSQHELAPVLAARKDWRNELQLQARLGRPDSGFPIRADGVLIFRSVAPDGSVEWWRETAASVSRSAWRVRRERLSDGAALPVGDGMLRIERRGSVFEIPGATVPLLDLAEHGPDVLAAPFPPTSAEQPPRALGIDDQALAAFRNSGSREACLLIAHDDVRRWISPRLGLVREETSTSSGWFTRELVYASWTP